MADNLKIASYKLGNIIYKYAFPVYKPLYFHYKKKSDKTKINLLKSIITPGMKVLDIGANIGFYSILFADLVGDNGLVYAFEPEEKNFKHLRYVTSKRKNIKLEKAAVSEKSGTIKLYHSKNLNVDHHTYSTGDNRKVSEIKSLALDDYFGEDEQIDFIKIDVQGYDYFSILGMKNTIKRSGRVQIFGEFWPYGLKKAGISFKDYQDLLHELGFQIQYFCSEDDVKNFGKKTDDWYFTTDFIGTKK